jgi:hypothetical protein
MCVFGKCLALIRPDKISEQAENLTTCNVVSALPRRLRGALGAMLFVLPNQLRIDFGTAHYSPEDALYRRMVGHSLFVAYLLTPTRRLDVEWHAPFIEDARQTDKCVV